MPKVNLELKPEDKDEFVRIMRITFEDGNPAYISVHCADQSRADRLADYITYALEEEWIYDAEKGFI